jgi:manganese/zinc/iron transport system substrate-binding protein
MTIIRAFSRCVASGLAAFLTLTACSRSPDPGNTTTTPGPDGLRVVATTGMVGDLARQIGGNRISLISLMGPGVDPHLYKATASDVSALQRAGVILYSGLHLEGRMGDLLESMQKAGRRVVAVTDAMPHERLIPTDAAGKAHDPHVWFDVALWSEAIGPVAEALAAADPANAEAYRSRAAEVRKEMLALDAWVRTTSASIPEERRVLVTSHDAFGYFGRAYGFRVVGLQGISTVTEAGLADMAKLADFVREQKVPALFVESSVPHTTLERISADTGARIGGELFSDAMGTPGRIEDGYDVGTYEGMVRHNMNTLARALR